MKHEVHINQKAIAELGIRGIDFNHMALYEFCKGIIDWKNSKAHEHSGVEYKWVSYKIIIQNMPMLDCSEKTLYRMVDRLCAAGMLQRCPDNKKKGMVFLALGKVGIALTEYLNVNSTGNDISDLLSSDKNDRGVGQKSLRGRTELSDNIIHEENTKEIINPTSPTPSDAVSPSEPETKTKRVRKARLTRSDVLSFYENEKRKSLETPLPKDLDAAAAAWRIPGEEVMKKLAAGYSEVVDFMLEPSDMWPQGMWRCVLTKPDQLEFLQFCRLVLQFGMTRAEIKENLTSWENKKYDNDNLYATLYTWKIKPRKQSYGEAMPPSGQARTGLSIPKQVRQ
mgnify:CR=1 FL=1